MSTQLSRFAAAATVVLSPLAAEAAMVHKYEAVLLYTGSSYSGVSITDEWNATVYSGTVNKGEDRWGLPQPFALNSRVKMSFSWTQAADGVAEVLSCSLGGIGCWIPTRDYWANFRMSDDRKSFDIGFGDDFNISISFVPGTTATYLRMSYGTGDFLPGRLYGSYNDRWSDLDVLTASYHSVDPAAVPLPASAALLVGGLGGLAALRRRRSAPAA